MNERLFETSEIPEDEVFDFVHYYKYCFQFSSNNYIVEAGGNNEDIYRSFVKSKMTWKEIQEEFVTNDPDYFSVWKNTTTQSNHE